MTENKEMQEKIEAFEVRVKQVTYQLLLDGMLPADIEKEARQRVAAEFKKNEQEIRDGVLYVMKDCFFLDGTHRWVLIGQIFGRFESEYPKVMATQNDVQEVVEQYVEEGLFNRRVFEGTKEKYQYRSNEKTKTKAPDRKPINPNDLPDW